MCLPSSVLPNDPNISYASPSYEEVSKMNCVRIFKRGRKSSSARPTRTVAASSENTSDGQSIRPPAPSENTSDRVSIRPPAPSEQHNDHLNSNPADPTGLTIVWPTKRTPPQDDSYNLDVVFVHGLNGGSFRTWTKDGVFWPTQFLPKVTPEARIMTFGYNANLFTDCASGRIAEFAQSLHSNLDMKRTKNTSRPILFICHSMGGLVVKRTLTIAHSKTSALSSKHVPAGIIFLATPHRGANSAEFADIGTRLWGAVRAGAPVTTSAGELKLFANVVTDIHTDFVPLSNRFKIISYMEQKGFVGIGTVVRAESAKMDITAEIHSLWLNATHVDMCRFSEENDPNYVQVSDGIDHLKGLLIADAAGTPMNTLNPDLLPTSPNQSLQIPGELPAFKSSGVRSSIDDRSNSITSTPGSHTDPLIAGLPQVLQKGFSGRDDILKAMHTHFDQYQDSTPAFGLYGQGGVGKTQVALKYVASHIDGFNAIFWVSADTEQKIVSGLETIAHKLNLSVGTPEETTEQVKTWLHANPGWLFIFDNADELHLLKPYWPTSFKRDGCIIVTSRDPGLRLTSSAVPVTKVNEVECFKEKEGEMVFWSLLSDPDPEEREFALEIVKKLGGLPLAINHMASYIDTQTISLSEFMTRYESHESDVIQQTPPGANFAYEKTLATAWTLSMSALNTDAANLLGILALLDPDEIPLEIIQHFEAKNESICIAARDFAIQNKALASLYHGSLVKKTRERRGPNYLRMHRLVQSAVRRQWELQERITPRNTPSPSLFSGNAPSSRADKVSDNHISSMDQARSRVVAFDSAIACISRLYPKQEKGQSMAGQFSECHKYSQHLLSIERFYSKYVDHVSGTDQFADTLAHCGWYFFEKGQTDSAKRVLLTAESICIRLYGNMYSQTLGLIYNNLGAVCMLRREYQEGLGYDRSAIKHRENSISHDDPEMQQVGVSYMNYANDLQNIKPFEEAEVEKYYKKALHISTSMPGRTASTSELVLSNISFTYYQWGRLPEALHYVTEAIKLHAECGEPTTFMLYTLYYHGEIQCAMGDLSEAYKTHKDCLEKRQKLQGDLHYTTGLSFYKTGQLAWRLEDYREAIQNWQKSVAAFKDYRDDPGLWPRSCIKLGKLLKEQGKNDEGQEMMEKGLRKAKELTGTASITMTDDELDSLVREIYR